MRILVTGSCGFIGSHLVDYLEEQRHDVDGIDDLRSSVRAPRKKDCRASLSLVEEIHHYYDEIYHLASPVGPVGLLDYAGEIADEIVKDAVWLANNCKEIGCRFLFVSTSEVYGANGACSERQPCQIDQANPSPRLEYAAGKLAAEIAIQNMVGLDYRIVRPFNVAGPRQRSKGGFVVPRFVEQALRGDPLTVYWDGSAKRAFTHVRDIVEGLVLVMRKGERGLPYNLGNPLNLTTIGDLAKSVVDVLGGMITHVNPRDLWGPTFAEAGDKWPAEISRAQALGWQPSRGIPQIIQETAEQQRTTLFA